MVTHLFADGSRQALETIHFITRISSFMALKTNFLFTITLWREREFCSSLKNCFDGLWTYCSFISTCGSRPLLRWSDGFTFRNFLSAVIDLFQKFPIASGTAGVEGTDASRPESENSVVALHEHASRKSTIGLEYLEEWRQCGVRRGAQRVRLQGRMICPVPIICTHGNSKRYLPLRVFASLVSVGRCSRMGEPSLLHIPMHTHCCSSVSSLDTQRVLLLPIEKFNLSF